MSNDKGLLSGSITILIGAVIAIMALVRGPWQAWLLIGVFTLWGLWVVLILLLPYMQQAKRRRQRQQRERRLHAEGIAQSTFQVPELEEPVSDDLLLRYANHRILAYLRSSYSDACFEWCEKRPAELIRTNGTGRIRLHNVDGFDHADITFGQDATIQCDLLKIVPLSKAGTEQGDEANTCVPTAPTIGPRPLWRSMSSPGIWCILKRSTPTTSFRWPLSRWRPPARSRRFWPRVRREVKTIRGNAP